MPATSWGRRPTTLPTDQALIAAKSVRGNHHLPSGWERSPLVKLVVQLVDLFDDPNQTPSRVCQAVLRTGWDLGASLEQVRGTD